MEDGITLKSLELNHFRSYKREALTFDSVGSILVGPNGSGKTNVLEAISLFSPGKGLRKSKNHEISRNPENLGWSIRGVFATIEDLSEIDVSFKESGEKLIFLDGKRTNQSSMNKFIKILWITPQMDRLWSLGASERRNFIDRITFSFFPNHAKIISSYEKLIRERNELLRQGKFENTWIDSLERQIVNFGTKVFSNRAETVQILNESPEPIFGFPSPRLAIIGEVFLDEDMYLLKLRQNRKLDSISGRTSLGPHRSDLNLTYIDKGIDAKDCSTGEQKALLVSIMLSISKEIINKSGIKPILLLDEIGAHLDDERRNKLMDHLFSLNVQFLITATEIDLFNINQKDINCISVMNSNGMSVLNQG